MILVATLIHRDSDFMTLLSKLWITCFRLTIKYIILWKQSSTLIRLRDQTGSKTWWLKLESLKIHRSHICTQNISWSMRESRMRSTIYRVITLSHFRSLDIFWLTVKRSDWWNWPQRKCSRLKISKTSKNTSIPFYLSRVRVLKTSNWTCATATTTKSLRRDRSSLNSSRLFTRNTITWRTMDKSSTQSKNFRLSSMIIWSISMPADHVTWVTDRMFLLWTLISFQNRNWLEDNWTCSIRTRDAMQSISSMKLRKKWWPEEHTLVTL